MDRETLRRKRRDVLKEIRRLDQERCEKCNDEAENKSSSEYHVCGCRAAKQIRKLGDQLLRLTSGRIDLAQEYLKTQPDQLTPELYESIKQAKVGDEKITDVQIMKRYGFNSTGAFVHWKRINGLQGKSLINS